MGWNYRVFKTKHPTCQQYDIREVHYKNDNDDQPVAYTLNPIKPKAFWEDEDSTPIKDLRWQLQQMLKALDKPVLTPQDFESEDE